MTEIVLTRKQLQDLGVVAEKFPDIELFTLRSENSSGIGPTVSLSFTLWGDKLNTKVDITDLSSW